MLDHRNDQPSGPGRRMQDFLEKLYWTLGIFCMIWTLGNVVGVLRRRSIELPIFGKCQLSETIIFSLLSLSVLLPCLLYVVKTYRAVARDHHWEARFPSAPTDSLNIPSSYRRLRVAIYVALVLLPAATMVFDCVRMTTEMCIEADNVKQRIEGTAIFQWPAAKSGTSAMVPDWRWIETGSEQLEGAKIARITALPFWEPWFFVLISTGCTASALYFLFASHKPKR